MKPYFLGLYNFRQHENTEINFEPGTIYSLLGAIDGDDKNSNGAGKSGIFFGLNFALWKQIDEKNKNDLSLGDVVQWDHKSCKVVFEFETTAKVRVERIVKLTTKSQTVSMRVWTEINGEWEEYEEREGVGKQEYLESYIGCKNHHHEKYT